MKLLNIGCGSTFHPAWINIDVAPQSPKVQKYDIRKKLPFLENGFDACYSSHVLEHLTKEEARNLLAECLRVLKTGSVVRIVVPDLEAIARNYLETLERVEKGIVGSESDYDWMLLEMYDQTVRQYSGGEMCRYLSRPDIKNSDFIRSRIGFESEINQASMWKKLKSKNPSWFIRKFRTKLAEILVALIAGRETQHAFKEGVFRASGEIHRWMYDRFSLQRMLEKTGFVDVRVCRADESRIPDFSSYNLDIIEGKIRKPDSLFMEGIKP
ncbi:methyltransferase domain-containing protein [Microcoleus sp. FACHB-68]|uniref:class I SAM-dependent methyltransferase n=1 Tax=Microcoleus sp. FACHB-68 TaxID=2692826 RepID=UPI0016849C88|nr:methyltransferase domain-containing protein [Microcoleus sp. FACHB-68]MBD1940414.1 methyltransferase domain-containing protein [Microcoleus sp. FACHB-68]